MQDYKRMLKRIPGVRSLLHARREGRLVLTHLAAQLAPARFEDMHRREVFKKIYSQNRWGGDPARHFNSGSGSRGDVVDAYSKEIGRRIRELSGKLGRKPHIVDLGCGDFEVGRALLREIGPARYTGCDIVPALIRHHNETFAGPDVQFQQLDIVRDPLPHGDVCLVRQVLQHLPNSDVLRILPKLQSFSVVFISEGQPIDAQGPYNPDKPVGEGLRFDWASGRGRGLEFDQAPFNLRTQEVLRVRSGATFIVTVGLMNYGQPPD